MSADLRENTADTQAKQTQRSRQAKHTQAKQTQALKTNTQISNKDRMANTQQQIPYTATAQGFSGMTGGWQARFPVDDEHVGFIIGKKGGTRSEFASRPTARFLSGPDERSGGKKWFLVRALFKKNLAAGLAELAMLGNRAPVKNRGYDVPSGGVWFDNGEVLFPGGSSGPRESSWGSGVRT